jgi:hypothetical protein
MNTDRRDFLRKISCVAALAASGSVLKKDAEAAAIHTSHASLSASGFLAPLEIDFGPEASWISWQQSSAKNESSKSS